MSTGSPHLRLALAQLDVTVGDLAGNRERIAAWVERARLEGADVVVFPELALSGYPPEDLLLQREFVLAAMGALRELVPACRGITAIVGTPYLDRDLYNAAAVIHDGRLAGVYRKELLPNYGVFDEQRYFRAGEQRQVYSLGEARFGVSICEDIWYAEGPPRLQASDGGAELLVNLSASPFYLSKGQQRQRMLATRAADSFAYVAYCNLVGGQDELVFDGQSLIFSPDGEAVARGPQFREDLVCADLDLSLARWRRVSRPGRPWGGGGFAVVELPGLGRKRDQLAAHPRLEPALDEVAEAYGALLLGTRDYALKNGFQHAVLGLSGGIDSSVAAAVAVAALGPDRLTAVMMPSRYTSPRSIEDAARVAENLGIELVTLPIDAVFQALLDVLAEPFAGREPDVAEENLQARVRGALLMALSNKFGWLVLTTGDKSEIAVGYTTLYGDTAGGFDVLKDVPKTLVYRLARHHNAVAGREVIPESVLSKPPSPELKAEQKSTDTLPEFAQLDPILHAYIEEGCTEAEMAARGFDPEVVRRVRRMADRAEYKRRQSPPGVKLTQRAFGRDWRMPITNRFRR